MKEQIEELIQQYKENRKEVYLIRYGKKDN